MAVSNKDSERVYEVLKQYLNGQQIKELVADLLALDSKNESFNETLRRILVLVRNENRA